MNDICVYIKQYISQADCILTRCAPIIPKLVTLNFKYLFS